MDCVFPFQLIYLLDEDGNCKHSHLSNLALTVLLLPHGNSDPERGLSLNKQLLERHSSNIQEGTLWIPFVLGKILSFKVVDWNLVKSWHI